MLFDVKIAVLEGGVSAEREVSLRSGAAVARGLKEAGFEQVTEIDITTDDPVVLSKMLQDVGPDLVFPMLHGRLGEDGRLQRLLDQMGLPYIGSGPQTHELAIDKVRTQAFLRSQGIRIPQHWVVRRGRSVFHEDIVEPRPEAPLIVKPSSEGSSLGVRTAVCLAELADAVAQAFDYDDVVLIERFVKGREITCSIVCEEVLPIVEIKTNRPFFDYVAKYSPGRTAYMCPAPLSPGETHQAQAVARRIFDLIGARDFLRIDMILSQEGDCVVLEINTIPGMTATSLLPLAASKAGVSFPELMRRLVRAAWMRRQTDGCPVGASPNRMDGEDEESMKK